MNRDKSTVESEIKRILDRAKEMDDIGAQDIFHLSVSFENSEGKRKAGLNFLTKEMKSADPTRGLMSVLLLEMMCGICARDVFMIEMCSHEWTDETKTFITNNQTNPAAMEMAKFLGLVAKENENNQKLRRLILLHKELKASGVQVTSSVETKPTKQNPPKSISSDQMDEDLKRAIELSLEESNRSHTTSRRIEEQKVASTQPEAPPVNTRNSMTGAPAKVLYDFEAAESNELTLNVGEMVTLLDTSNEYWWMGQIGSRKGLFPSNFVTTDLAVSVEKATPEVALVDEKLIDTCLGMLANANSLQVEDQESIIIELEKKCKEMDPQVSKTLSALNESERKYSELDLMFNNVLLVYQRLMEESRQFTATGTNTTEAPVCPPPHQYYAEQQPCYLPAGGPRSGEPYPQFPAPSSVGDYATPQVQYSPAPHYPFSSRYVYPDMTEQPSKGNDQCNR